MKTYPSDMSRQEILRAAINDELKRHGLSLLELKRTSPQTDACLRDIRRRTINSLTLDDLAGWLNVNPSRLSKLQGR